MRHRRQRWRRLRATLVLAVVGLLGRAVQLLPWRVLQAVGGGLGRLAWVVARRDRRRALEHLAIAFPELSAKERARLGRRSMAHFGTTLMECLWLLRRDCAAVLRRVEVDGWSAVEAARRAGRPVIIMTGHCGNWELLAATLSCSGLPLSTVARRLDDERLNALLTGLRARYGTESIERGTTGAARKLLRALRSEGALGMLIDQDTRVDGVWVPFFGKPAYTPVGAAEIALRQEAAVIPTFIARLPDGRHRATLAAPLELPEDVTEATALMTSLIEEQIRRHPEQWVWMHRRWRRQPSDP